MAQKSGKINGAQETKGCRQVKGQEEEDEQCGAGEISQFTDLEISHRFTNFQPTTTPAKIENQKL